MEDWPSRIADALESFTARVRAITVDRVARVIRIVAAGMVAALIGLIALILLLIGLFRLLGDLVGDQEIAYAIGGGLFLVAGALVWSRRIKRTTQDTP